MDSAKYRQIVETFRNEILSGRRRSGDSFPSVRALMRRFGVSNATAQRVLSELVRLGCVAVRKGSGAVVTQYARSRKIGLIVPALPSAEIFAPICHEISRQCQDSGRLLFFADEPVDSTDRAGRRIRKLAETLIAENVAGILYHPVDYCANAERINRTVVGLFRKANIPVVLIDCGLDSECARDGLDMVGVDNVAVGHRLGRHMVGCGARKILYVARTRFSSNVANRFLGMRAAIEGEPGVTVEQTLVSPETRTRFLASLKRRCPDAIVCSSDFVAANVLEDLRRIGKRVPVDVLLAGVNDVNIARVSSPALTTVRQPCVEIGRLAFELLEWRLAHPDAIARQVLLPTELVVRESTGVDAGARQ